MKNYYATFLVLLSLILFSSTATLASEKIVTAKNSASKEAVALRGTIRPYGDGRSDKFTVTVRFDMGTGWYTYKDAGQSTRQPTSLTLKLPEGAKVVDDWSHPIGTKGMEAQAKIYTGRVDFTTNVTLEPSAYGKEIEVLVSYQACTSEHCNRPEKKTIRIAIPGADTDTAKLFEKPVRVMVKGEFLNTVAKERYPSPAILDIDGDGQKELVIGGLSGRLGIYENLNTSGAGDPIWGPRRLLMGSSGKQLRTLNWCCVGASPQFVDINGDGRKDILVGSFSGIPQWLMNTVDGFGESTHIRDKNGDLVTLTQFWGEAEDGDWTYDDGDDSVISSSVAAVDWDDDGDMDLLLGGYTGEVLELRLNEGTKGGAVQFASSNLPVIVGGKPFSLLSGGYGIGSPRIVDWDEDGLFDILIGTIYGEVFLLQNTGSKGAPAFSEITTLVEPFLAPANSKWIKQVPSKDGAPSGPGSSYHIEAVDYDGDGDLDLLVGARSEWLVGEMKVPTVKELKLQEKLTKEAKEAWSKVMEYEATAKDEEALKKLKETDKYDMLISKYNKLNSKANKVTADPTKRGDFVWLYRRK